jgi:putative MATE family efflux protein
MKEEFSFSILSLGTSNAGKLLIKYSLPAIVAATAMSLYSIIDSIFIGHGVNSMALSGLATSFPLMSLQNAFGTLTSIGGAVILSIRLGQKDYKATNYILCNVVIINIIVGLLTTILVLLFLKPILLCFGASSQSLPYAYSFMSIIMIGNTITNTYLGLNALIRASGHPGKAMNATLITIFMNIVLNYIFIFQLHYGIAGSAWATVMSQLIMLIWQVLFFNKKTNVIVFQKQFFCFKKDIVKDIFSIGFSPFLLHCVTSLIIILINKKLSFYGGDVEVGAYGIVNRMCFLFIMITIGINQGLQPIAGYNYGAGLYARVTEVFKKAATAAMIIMLFGTISIELFPYMISSLFTNDNNLIKAAAKGLRYMFIFAPFAGFQLVSIGFFQSIGKAYKAIMLTLTRQVAIIIPLLIILPKYLGSTGVWVSYPISDFLSTLLAIYMTFMQYKSFSTKKFAK